MSIKIIHSQEDVLAGSLRPVFDYNTIYGS